MLRRPAILAIALAAIALLGPGSPAGAHLGAPALPADVALEVASHPADPAPSEMAGAVGRALTAAPDGPQLPWLAILGGLAAVAVACRRPRRAVAVGLALLLAVFAFEDGLHSVHHGFDPGKAAACNIAAASQHLSATAVDHPVPAETALPLVAVAAEGHPLDPASRFLCPAQGRGPPLLSV